MLYFEKGGSQLIAWKIVFIVGAGASADYGFSVGGELLEKIFTAAIEERGRKKFL